MEIVTDEVVLRTPSEPVRNLKEGGEIARKLHYALNRINVRAHHQQKRYNSSKEGTVAKPLFAVGLSAPQIGIQKQVCLVAISSFRMVLINPRVVAHADYKIPWREGCLSFPGKEVDTWRWPWIEVETLDFSRRVIGLKDQIGTDLVFKSVVAQHEICHLQGLLYTDFQTQDYPDWSEATCLLNR